MGRTQLFQKPGSPLIQGHSRVEQPFWRDWAIGGVLAWLSVGAIGIMVDPAAWGDLGIVLDDLLLVMGYGALPAILGSALGVWLASGMGWRKRWISAAVCALLAAVVFITVRALTMG